MKPCPWCSTEFSVVFHIGGPCPNVEEVEYFENGKVKRIKFRFPKEPNNKVVSPYSTKPKSSNPYISREYPPPTITWSSNGHTG